MEEYTKVALDAMGGDNAPTCNVEGALAAVAENDKLLVQLVGKKEKIEEA